jgi:endonuclease/exonuclease/phosphatase family metal-dependent hydrolase
MKRSIAFVIAVCWIVSIQAQSLNIMTFNIRLNVASDSLNAWPYRKDKVASQILFHEANIVGVQEALYDQMMDLQTRLTGYKYVGGGRDDGKQKGEFSAIFYDTTRLQLLQSQTFWLSEQPTVPGSKGWDAAITRIVTWAKFKDRKTKKQFYAFNTHFDHMGKVARRESARLLLKKVKEIAGYYPVVVTGDFNSKPSDEPIQVITDTNNTDHLIDSKSISATAHYGPTGTFNGFQSKEVDGDPIDYIFLKNGGRVVKHATFSQSWNGHFSSDHFPVFARISF